MITPGKNHYEVVLDNQYYLRELLESIILEDSLDEIAYRADVKITITPDFPGIAPGQEVRVSGTPFDENRMVYLLHPGVVWTCDSTTKGQKHLTATIYDRTIYLSKSEDEYLFPSGQTASQRLKQYAKDWGIPIKSIPNTKIPLAKAVYRAQPLWAMIMKDLKETATKGGDMFIPRMTPYGLELFKLGSNNRVWVLDIERNIESINQVRTLDETVTQVKICGNVENESRSPVLAVLQGDIAKYGTLQKIIAKEKDDSLNNAKIKGKSLLCGVQETITVFGIDINTIRAGDRVQLNSMDLIATSIRHELGSPGHMTVVLGNSSYVRRKYYAGSI